MLKIRLFKTLNGHNGKFNLNINLDIKSGEIISIYGKSGSGKTSILRLIAGLENNDNKDSYISFKNKIFLSENTNLKIQDRKIGFVFQDYALFENLSPLNNLLFANKDLNLANELLNLMELENLKNCKINSLSGGQKQRLAIARILMQKTDILLLDEPFSALDNKLKDKIRNYILEYHKIYKPIIILVSHDVDEICKFANKVAILENGKIKEIQDPNNFFLTDKMRIKITSINKSKIEFQLSKNAIFDFENAKDFKQNEEAFLQGRFNLRKIDGF